MLHSVGMDADAFQAALAAHSLSMDAVLGSLRDMQARQNAHDAKLDRLLSMLQAGTQLRDKPADIIEWEDIRVSEERIVGASGTSAASRRPVLCCGGGSSHSPAR